MFAECVARYVHVLANCLAVDGNAKSVATNAWIGKRLPLRKCMINYFTWCTIILCTHKHMKHMRNHTCMYIIAIRFLRLFVHWTQQKMIVLSESMVSLWILKEINAFAAVSYIYSDLLSFDRLKLQKSFIRTSYLSREQEIMHKKS